MNTAAARRRQVLVPLAGVVLIGALVISAIGWFGQRAEQERQVGAVAQAVIASGRTGEVVVELAPGAECPRGQKAFRWSTRDAAGGACVGPREQVTLQPPAAAAAGAVP